MTYCKTEAPEPPKPQTIQGSYVARNVRKFFADLEKRSGVVSTAQQMNATLAREYTILAANAAHIPLLKKYGKLENMLATALGWKTLLFDNPTNAGSIRNFFLERTKAAANLLEVASLYKSLPDIQKLYHALGKRLSGLDELTLQELLYDHIVVGQFYNLQNIYDSPVVHAQLQARYQKHFERLQDIGFTPVEITEMDRLAGRISGQLDALRAIAGKEGLDIPILQNGGYLPLRATEEIKRFLKKETVLEPTANSIFDLNTVFNKSRASNVPYVVKPEDMAALIGVSKLEMADLLTRPGELSRLLREKLKPETIDKLVKRGWLTEVPAMSDELTEFIDESFDLPSSRLAERIVLNPVKAITDYTEELKSVVQTSSLLKTILTDGLDNGWVKLQSEVKNSPEFVQIGSNADLQKLIRSNNLRDDISGLYVHRTIAEQMVSVLKLNQSWADQSMIGNVWRNFTSTFRKMAIVGTGGIPYIQRVFVQNVISTYAATGSLGQMGYGFADVFRIIRNQSFDVLDSKRKFATVGGKDYSVRELFDAYFLKRGSSFVSSTQEYISTTRELFTNNRPALRRHIELTKEYHRRYPSPITGADLSAGIDLASESLTWMLDSAYRKFAGVNIAMDIAARWTAIRELALSNKRQWRDLDELIQYTDEYFNIQEDVGSFGRAYGSVGQPFAAFALAAPGSAIRHVMRNPWQAGRMGLLFAQADTANELSDAEMAQWQKDSYSVTLFTDPITGNRYGLFPEGVDFYLSTGVLMRELAEDVGRAFGQDVGSAKEVYEQAQDPATPIKEFLSSVFEQSYGGDLLAAVFLEYDVRRKQSLSGQTSSLLNFELPKAVREALVNTFPLLNSIDRQLPLISGTQPTIDPITQRIVTPGEPGILGNIPKPFEGGARRKTSGNAIQWLAQEGFGLSVQEISPVRNLISNYKDFGEYDSKLSTSINQIEDQILNERDPARIQKLTATMIHMQRLRIWLAFQKYRIDLYAKDYGIPSVAAVEQFRQAYDVPRDKSQDLLLFLQEDILKNGNYGNPKN